MISQAAEDYLKVIYKLQKGRDRADKVTTSLIADRMAVAAASVTNMVKKLAEMRLLQHTPYQGVVLTRAGEKIALATIRHHRLLELYLSAALGYPWDEVDQEAERLEHAISEDFEDRIDRVLGHPTVGAHGEPIPTKQGEIETPGYERLSTVRTGHTAIVREVSDRDPEILRYMDRIGLSLGAAVEIRERSPDGPLVVTIDADRRAALSLEVAEHIFVDPAEVSAGAPDAA